MAIENPEDRGLVRKKKHLRRRQAQKGLEREKGK